MITMEFDYINMPEATVNGIAEAIENKQPFGLVGKHGRNIVIFSIAHLKSWWVLKNGYVQAAYSYQNEKAFIDAVSMQLLSHKNFISAELLLQAPTTQKLLS
jgi:hypothetical protein